MLEAEVQVGRQLAGIWSDYGVWVGLLFSLVWFRLVIYFF